MAYTLVPTELIVDGAVTSAKLDTNISISGTLGVTGELTLATHMIMGDNDKIKIGTGGDLEIYHDGSNSYISNSTGNIYLADTNGSVHIQAKLNEESIVCTADGAVSLYHDNAVKLATSSSGIDVTGTVVADGLTVDSSTLVVDSTNNKVGIGTDSPTKQLTISGDNVEFLINRTGSYSDTINMGMPSGVPTIVGGTHLAFGGSGTWTEHMRIDSSGNVLIGGTSATFGVLGVESSGNCNVDFFSNSGSSTAAKTELFFSGGISGNSHVSLASIVAQQASGDEATRKGELRFLTANSGGPSTKMIIKADGNVGIGTDSPSASLSILSSQDATTDIRHYASFGADATFDDTDVKDLFGAGVGELQIKNGTSSRCGILALGGSLSAGEALGAIAFYRSGNTDGYRHRATIQGGVTSSGTANQYGGNLIFRTATDGAGSPSERMRIASDGGVGIGQTTPYVHSSFTSLSLGGTSGKRGLIQVKNENDSANGYLYAQADALTLESTSTNILRFVTNAAERGRIDNDGIMLLGTTTRAIGTAGNVNKFGVAGGSNSVFPMVVFADQDTSVEGGSVILELSYDADTSYSSANYVLFTDNTSTQGSISGTGNQTVSFNTSSDRRLKENIVNTESQLEKIKQIEVRDFNYIGNDITTTGMIAQELNEIIPNVVVEGLEDFKRHPWSIDYGKLTPYLIKAIQEQQTIIDDLKTRIETLENE